MSTSSTSLMMPTITSKIYCSSNTLTTLIVRRRPRVVSGGGFVVINGGDDQKVNFVVDGCGTLGAKGHLILKDGDGGTILSISKKGGTIQAFSTCDRWNGYLIDYEGAKKFIFKLTDPKFSMLNNKIRIQVLQPKRHYCNWDYEVTGSFLDRTCQILDNRGNVIAQQMSTDVASMRSKDMYCVKVQPGQDQAFVVGVLAVLDNIYGESTSC